MRGRTTTAAAAGALLLALTGCTPGKPVDPVPTPTPPAAVDRGHGEAPTDTRWPRPIAAGSGLWFVTAENAVGKFTLPGDPDPAAEELRERAGGDPVTYTTVTVDNRHGTTGVDMHALVAHGADGRKVRFRTVDAFMDEWSQRVPDDGASTHDPFAGRSGEPRPFANAGEVEEFVMATRDTDLPAEFTRVTVQAHGAGDPVRAYPPADSAYVDLDFAAPRR
jgi:hypothetical protein